MVHRASLNPLKDDRKENSKVYEKLKNELLAPDEIPQGDEVYLGLAVRVSSRLLGRARAGSIQPSKRCSVLVLIFRTIYLL